MYGERRGVCSAGFGRLSVKGRAEGWMWGPAAFYFCWMWNSRLEIPFKIPEIWSYCRAVFQPQCCWEPQCRSHSWPLRGTCVCPWALSGSSLTLPVTVTTVCIRGVVFYCAECRGTGPGAFTLKTLILKFWKMFLNLFDIFSAFYLFLDFYFSTLSLIFPS